jgi:hypothetical protein
MTFECLHGEATMTQPIVLDTVPRANSTMGCPISCSQSQRRRKWFHHSLNRERPAVCSHYIFVCQAHMFIMVIFISNKVLTQRTRGEPRLWGNCHTSLSLMSIHTISIHKSHLEIATRKNQHSTNSMVSSLWLLLITELGHLGIQEWAPLTDFHGEACSSFHKQKGYPVCMICCYIESSGWMSQRGQYLEEFRVC